MRKIFNCLNCEKQSDVCMSKLSKKNRGKGMFCSNTCHYAYYRKYPEKRPLYKPEWCMDQRGYLSKKVVCVDGVKREMRQHRYLMEMTLGRRLLTDEHVHHVNGIKTDNRPENLQVLNNIEHCLRHSDHGRKNIKKALAVLAEKRREWSKTHWARNYTRCVTCKTTGIKHQGHGNCKKCYLLDYRKCLECFK